MGVCRCGVWENDRGRVGIVASATPLGAINGMGGGRTGEQRQRPAKDNVRFGLVSTNAECAGAAKIQNSRGRYIEARCKCWIRWVRPGVG